MSRPEVFYHEDDDMVICVNSRTTVLVECVGCGATTLLGLGIMNYEIKGIRKEVVSRYVVAYFTKRNFVSYDYKVKRKDFVFCTIIISCMINTGWMSFSKQFIHLTNKFH